MDLKTFFVDITRKFEDRFLCSLGDVFLVSLRVYPYLGLEKGGKTLFGTWIQRVINEFEKRGEDLLKELSTEVDKRVTIFPKLEEFSKVEPRILDRNMVYVCEIVQSGGFHTGVFPTFLHRYGMSGVPTAVLAFVGGKPQLYSIASFSRVSFSKPVSLASFFRGTKKISIKEVGSNHYSITFPKFVRFPSELFDIYLKFIVLQSIHSQRGILKPFQLLEEAEKISKAKIDYAVVKDIKELSKVEDLDPEEIFGAGNLLEIL